MRGTIGGEPGSALTPIDIVKLCSAYGSLVLEQGKGDTIIMGRDARLSGDMVSSLAASTFVSMGLNVTDLGLSTTPTVEMAVKERDAAAGVIITASHNPGNWNALKFLDENGEFISQELGKRLLELAENDNYSYAEVGQLGEFNFDQSGLEAHIDSIKNLGLVSVDSIKEKGFRIAVDGVNSSGGIAIPKLLLDLGIEQIIQVNCDPTGHFAHNPEPLPENLNELSAAVIDHKCDLGIAVDPDVDRLALIDEKGNPFGEEYTLVAVSDYVLKNQPGAVVSNMSSSRALRDLAIKYGMEYHSSPVGEVHVVQKMKEVNAVIGGEGNGGVIYPELHYGRDALVGVALLLSHLALEKKSLSQLKNEFEDYFIFKDKIQLQEGLDIDKLMESLKSNFKDADIDERDGVKFDFQDSWAHLRRSNTEPIIRIYAEGRTETEARNLAERVKRDVQNLIR